MSFQQNINQMLGNVTIGAGLWANSPGGRRFLEAKQINKDMSNLQKQKVKAAKNLPEEESFEVIRNLDLQQQELLKSLNKVNPGAKVKPIGSVNTETEKPTAAIANTYLEAYQETEGGKGADFFSFTKKEQAAIKAAKASAETKDIKNIQRQELNKNLTDPDRMARLLEGLRHAPPAGDQQKPVRFPTPRVQGGRVVYDE